LDLFRRVESSGQCERIGMFFNDQDHLPEEAQVMLTHRPALDPEDFHEYDAESGKYTITLVYGICVRFVTGPDKRVAMMSGGKARISIIV